MSLNCKIRNSRSSLKNHFFVNCTVLYYLGCSDVCVQPGYGAPVLYIVLYYNDLDALMSVYNQGMLCRFCTLYSTEMFRMLLCQCTNMTCCAGFVHCTVLYCLGCSDVSVQPEYAAPVLYIVLYCNV